MPKHSEKLRKIGIALAVSALTGSLTASTWAATNAPGTGNGVAIGEGATAAGNSEQSSIAIGKDAEAKYDGSMAIGDGAKISGNGAIAVGQNASSESGQAISIGVGAKSKGDGSYAIGGNANAEGLGSIVIGKDTKAASGNSIVIGTNSKAESYTTSAVAIGDNIKLDGNYGSLVAIGSEANASGIGAVALGANAKTSVEGGVAIGRSSLANRAAGGYGYIPQSGDKTGFIGGLGGITPDREAVFNAQRNQDIETSVYKSTGGAVSVGRDAYTATDGTKVLALTRQITNVAAGGQDTDAVNLRQLKDLSQAVGTQLATKLDANAYKYVSINSSETGNKDNKGATGGNSIAIGPNATATAVSNVAIGENSTAGGKGFRFWCKSR